MMNEAFEYPALYESADGSSACFQATLLNLIRIEYALLILCAIFSMNFSKEPWFFAMYALVLVGALGTLISRTFTKPEQGWYRGRALAESIKTSCWRYCMRAEPFENCENIQVPLSQFRNHLLQILRTNQLFSNNTNAYDAERDQITPSMQAIRALSLEDRKEYYLLRRIKEQRTWYQKKSIDNRNASRFWVGCAVASYAVAIALALSRIVLPNWELWPIDPVLVFASSIIGWTQVKRFNELSSSYQLTAHEIGIIQGRINTIQNETEFSEFINDAEQAFSREHTQWAARQQS